jgi:hypothetical protein
VAAALIIAAVSAQARAELVGYWALDGDVQDQSGKGNHGILLGATYDANVPTQIGSGTSLLFDADNEVVHVADSPSLDITGPVSLSAWVYSTADQQQWAKIVDKVRNTSYPYQLDFSNTTDEMVFTVSEAEGTSYSVQSNSAIPQNQWRHVAGVFDGTTLRLYVGGQLQTQTAPGTLALTNDNRLSIGARYTSASDIALEFQGRIDDVAVWDHALPGDQVALLASGARTPLTVPEPSGFALVVLAFFGSAWLLRRRNRT